MAIVLASASPRRKELMEMLGVKELVVRPADGEEKAADGLKPAELVQALASHKAHEVALRSDPGDVIVAADTIVWLGDRVFGKPKDEREAAGMLRALSGRAHEVFTGVSVIRGGKELTRAVCSEVRFRPLSELPDKISKMTGYPEDRSCLPVLIKELSPWFDVITHDEYDYIEIVPRGYSKGTGVKQIIKELGVSVGDTYGFGDSGNDIPMLEAVGTAVVMGDAPDDLKARYMTTDSLYSDGLAKALLKLGLI